MSKKSQKIIQEFIDHIHEYVNYWNSQSDRSTKEKLEGLAFSILCMLDGVSGGFDGNIKSLNNCGNDFMFHNSFYKNHNIDQKDLFCQ